MSDMPGPGRDFEQPAEERLGEARHTFDVVLRGYDRQQVAEAVERLDADFRTALADRDAAMARSADLAIQLSAMHGQLESLRRRATRPERPERSMGDSAE